MVITDGRVGAYAWIERDGFVLLTLWEGSPLHGIGPRWGLPGGGVEWGEQVHEACVREVWEETGYEVEVADLLGITVVHVEAEDRLAPGTGPLRLIRVLSRAVIRGGELTHEVDGSTLRAAWFRREHLADLPREQVLDWAMGLVDDVPESPGQFPPSALNS